MPLFPELRSELEKHFSQDEFVIQGLQGTSWNLHDVFQKIADRAGLGVVVRPFDNMRTSRSNEVLRRWGSQKESRWIGHSVETMEKHYFELEDDDFLEAAE